MEERDADFVFLNVGTIIDSNVIFCAFEALMRIEISHSIHFDQLERDILDSIFNIQRQNNNHNHNNDLLFLKRVDEALRFIFCHNVAKAVANNNNNNNNNTTNNNISATHHTTNIDGWNLRALILQAPKKLNALIIMANNNNQMNHNNANNNNINEEHRQDLEIGYSIVNAIERALIQSHANHHHSGANRI